MRTSIFRNLLISMILLMGASQVGVSQMLMYDNFDYPAGDSLIWHNWLTQQTNTTNAIRVSNGGLTYTNYPGSAIGNAAAVGTTGQDVFRGFVKQTLAGSNLYMAFLVKVTAATTGDCFITFKESATSPTNLNFRGRAYAKADASNNVAFGISKGAITSPAVADYTSAIYSLNTTYLLVVKYKIIDGANNDSAFLFVNPVIGNPEPAPTVIATDMTPSDLGLGSVLLRQGTTGASPTVIVDGVRVSKSWVQALVPSNISSLSDLQVDGTAVANFSPTVLSYFDTVPEGQPTVAIAATATDWAATVTISAAPSIPGISTILVTAENGNNTTTYNITHAYAYHTVDVIAAPPSTGTVTGSGVYGQGFEATVTATAATDYIFLNWTENGNVVSTSPVYTFTVTGNTTMIANFVPAYYEIDATVDPLGTVLGTGTYAYGDDATLTAISNTGYDFVEWTENGVVIGTDSNLVISNITADHDVVAHFILETYMITTTAEPLEGGSITGGGTYNYGTNVSLNASPNSGYIFENWTEDGVVIGTDPVLTLNNLSSDHDIIGNFTESINTYTVSASVNPPEAGTISGSGNVPLGGSITLTATGNPYYIFQNWTEDGIIIGTDTSITLTNVTQNHFLIANYLSTVGVGEVIHEEIRVYPTFTSEYIHIEASSEINELNVFNMMGQKIIHFTTPSKHIILNTSDLQKGTYIIKIVCPGSISTRKIIVY